MIKNIIKKIYFFRSFKELKLKKFLKIAMWDILFIMAILAVTALFTASIRLNLNSLTSFDRFTPELENMMKNSQKQVNLTFTQDFKTNFDEIRKSMGYFLVKMSISIVVYIAMLAIVFGAIKGKSYSVLTERKFNKKYFIKFSLSSLVWIVLWIAILATTIFGIKIQYNTIPIVSEIILFLMTAPLFFGFCSEKINPFINLWIYFKLVILRSYRFVISFAIILLFAAFSLLLLLTLGVFLKQIIYFFILPLAIFSFSVWTKYYLYLIAKDTEKEL